MPKTGDETKCSFPTFDTFDPETPIHPGRPEAPFVRPPPRRIVSQAKRETRRQSRLSTSGTVPGTHTPCPTATSYDVPAARRQVRRDLDHLHSIWPTCPTTPTTSYDEPPQHTHPRNQPSPPIRPLASAPPETAPRSRHTVTIPSPRRVVQNPARHSRSRACGPPPRPTNPGR